MNAPDLSPAAFADGDSHYLRAITDMADRRTVVTQEALYNDRGIKLVDKGRGRPGALVAMFKQLDALGGIDPRYGYTLLYSDNKQLIAPVHHYMHQNLQLTGGRVAQLGPTIGTHVGPGVVGVVFVAKE